MIVEVTSINGNVDKFNDATAEIAGTAFVVAQKNETTIFADGNWAKASIKKEEEPGVKLD